ncbi:MAG: ArsR/SmtB family transcription factor [Phycisphaerales bacterium]
MKQVAKPNQLMDRLAALGDPIRLRMLRLLEREELTVGELAKVVQLPQSTVSRHLKVLADLPTDRPGRAWLAKRNEGTATHYRLVLDDLPMDCRTLWLTVREQFEDEQPPEVAEDHRRLAAVLNDRRTDTQSFFGRVAGEWDGVRSELFGQAFTVQSMLTLLPGHWVVADLGCGTGNAAELLAPVVKRVLAVDQSEAMLSAAKKRLKGIDKVDFLRGDLEALPIETGSVDAAVCVLVLHHLPDPAKAICEMARILRPDGVALVVDMVAHNRDVYRHTMGHRWQGFGVPEMIRWMNAAGLERPRVTVLPSESDAKGPGLFACTGQKGREASGVRREGGNR